MKIDSQGSDTRVLETQSAGADRHKAHRVAPSPLPGDQSHISDDVQLAGRATQAALAESDIRPDAVARGRALLESGTLGQNVDSLAHAMIDSLLS